MFAKVFQCSSVVRQCSRTVYAKALTMAVV